MSTKDYDEFERWRRQQNAKKLLNQKTKNAPRIKKGAVARGIDTYLSGDWLRIDTYVKDPPWMDKLMNPRRNICK